MYPLHVHMVYMYYVHVCVCVGQRVEKLIKSIDMKRNDKILQSLTQSLQTTVATKLDKSVKNETKNSIIPGNIYCIY